MTKAQERLAVFVRWVEDSSASYKAPLGKATIDPGVYAVFVPQDLSLPPGPTFAPEHLPVWIPASQSIPGIPPYTQDPPVERGSIDSRVRHVVWMFQEGRFQGALVGLTDPNEPLQSALDRQLPGLDLTEHPTLFLPVWPLKSDARSWALAQLPVLRN